MLAVGMLVASAGPGCGSGAAALAPGTQFTPLTAAVMTEPTPFDATDGRTHLAYELLTTSALSSSTPVRLDRVDVKDARTRQVIGSLSGRALAEAANPVGDPCPVRTGTPRRPRRRHRPSSRAPSSGSSGST
ncbi:hypothetical protein ACFQ0M_45655 [Kitasatospora aburaviensis]